MKTKTNDETYYIMAVIGLCYHPSRATPSQLVHL